MGFSPKEIYANPLIIRDQIYKDDQKYIITSKKDFLKLSKNNHESKALVRFINKKKQNKYLEIIANPVYDSNSNMTGIIGSIRDVTKRKETEELLIETKNKFETK